MARKVYLAWTFGKMTGIQEDEGVTVTRGSHSTAELMEKVSSGVKPNTAINLLADVRKDAEPSTHGQSHSRLGSIVGPNVLWPPGIATGSGVHQDPLEIGVAGSVPQFRVRRDPSNHALEHIEHAISNHLFTTATWEGLCRHSRYGPHPDYCYITISNPGSF